MEKEKKATFDQIFTNGKNFKFASVDYSTEKIGEEAARLQKRQEEIIAGIIPWNDPELREIVFDIQNQILLHKKIRN